MPNIPDIEGVELVEVCTLNTSVNIATVIGIASFRVMNQCLLILKTLRERRF